MKFPKLLSIAFLSCLLPVAGMAASSDWMVDYDEALKVAKEENRLVFIDFTGSDWCGWCIKLDEEILSKRKFQKYAEDNLVLVKIDFPRKTKLPKDQAEANAALAKKYGIEGFPTIIVLNSKGKRIGELGYMKGGPEAMIEELEKLAAK
jgi:protein disulfide-isomerase